MPKLENASSNSRRIVKNTGLLYFRMLLIMLVTLYTSRLVLKVLGVEDYGIYNVVGGVVTMFSFLNGALNIATQRFLNYEMGKGNQEAMCRVFSMSVWSFLLLSLIAIILAETIGLWFVETKLNIPEQRMIAAKWVYHFSVAAFVVHLLTDPFNATIIAHEKMSIYAFVSIGEVLLKLALVYLLIITTHDKLWLYGLLMLLVTLLMGLTYGVICTKSFKECRLTFTWDKELFYRLFSFSGWMLSGAITNVLSTQGVNILINIFFSPVYNASRSIAMQVYGAINSFVTNFMTAVRPQVVKSYANGDNPYMLQLVFSSSKIAFYLLLLFVTPILSNTREILDLWLEVIPDKSVLFTQLVLVNLLIVSAYTPIAYVSQASGKIRDYQLVISVCFLLIAVLTWGCYKSGMPVETTFYIAIIVDLWGWCARLWVLKQIVDFPVRSYVRQVIYPVFVVFALSSITSILINYIVPSDKFAHLCINVMLCMAVTTAIVWLVGLAESEKKLICEMIAPFIKRSK